MKFEKNVIDSHMHLSNFENSEGEDFYTFFDEKQKEHGLKSLNLCACPICSGWGIANNIMCALYKLHNPTAYAYGSFFYPDMPIKIPMPEGMDFLTQYNELLELGFDGIKMLETKALEQSYYKVYVDADYYEDYFSKCEKDGTHIIWHVADPDSFWDLNRIHPRHLAKGWYYGEGDFMSWEGIYKMVYNVLDRHPKLKITFAHFFFYSEHPEWLVELFEKYPNVGIDLTPGAEMYNAFRDNNEYYRDFFIKYADRIMYGTDVSFPGSAVNAARTEQVYRFITTDDELTVVDIKTKGVGLPDGVCDKILYKNFESAAGEKPKVLNRELLKKYIQKYKQYIEDKSLIRHLKDINMY